MINKYRVHEVAKDFDVPSKSILTILEKHFEEKKKSMTALEENELDIIFEVFTQENSVESFDEYFTSGEKEEAEQVEEKPAEKTEKAEKAPKKTEKSSKNAEKPAKEKKDEKDTKAAAKKPAEAPKKKAKDPNAKIQSRTKGEARTVDTRANDVDLDKYNERYENIAPVNHDKRSDRTTNNQKINQKSKQYRKQGMRSSRHETEAEKLKRIAAERAKKPQMKIQVPDEIAVGELAELLHMTAAEVIKKLFALGQMATVNEVIDYDTAEIVATELGAKCVKEVVVTIE
ncbi:MAG: translation initiation factor IF-2 N-terminal domain-containing protein, partial [Ruminococcus sp.]|nr:translation initiation factor IF-2 N-terminal domain-containing protein [Candidatus Copronaster equi]